MVTLIQREFSVCLPVQKAWAHLARIEQWPSWAPHIKQIELHPSGELGPQSAGRIHLTNGMQPTFRMTPGSSGSSRWQSNGIGNG